MTAAALARARGLPEEEITAVETGACVANMIVYGRLARMLGIDPEDVVPEAS